VVPARKPAASQKPDAELPQAAPAVPQQLPTNRPPAPSHNAVPLKIFFLIVSIGLFFSTLSGLYMSYKYIQRKVLITCVLIAGVTVPIALTILF
jgi:magnesium-transporting ATPase (P-type)